MLFDFPLLFSTFTFEIVVHICRRIYDVFLFASFHHNSGIDDKEFPHDRGSQSCCEGHCCCCCCCFPTPLPKLWQSRDFPASFLHLASLSLPAPRLLAKSGWLGRLAQARPLVAACLLQARHLTLTLFSCEVEGLGPSPHESQSPIKKLQTKMLDK